MNNPFLETIGARLIEHDSGRARMELPVTAKLLNSQMALHGGVIATLLDSVCGYAGLHRSSTDGWNRAVTVSLNVAYLAYPGREVILAAGRLEKTTRSLFFAYGEVWSGDTLIATGQGVFKFVS